MANPNMPRGWWKRYRSLLSPGAGPVQIRETQKAFIAGMYAVLDTVKHLNLEDEDAAVEHLERFREEMVEMATQAMAEELTEGRMTN